MKLSSVVLSRNSEKTLGSVVRELKAISDEVLVIDDGSTDNTRKLARALGARVFKRELAGDFAGQRNFALTRAKGEWVLFVDSDEEVRAEMGAEILKAVEDSPGISGYMIRRRDVWLGREMVGGESGNTWLLRLARRDAGVWERAVHETWNVSGKVGKLNNILYHYPHASVGKFIEQVNAYAKLHSMEHEKELKSVGLSVVVFYPILKFVNNYIVKRGYRDGVHGFVAAVIMSLHSFLAWGNYYINTRQKR